ncbi:MAG TPA: SCO6880 family protein [Acidimicrobiales bacterium]|nr:SCO6880 family protein [Acidimicrobiales bacterium]
MADPEPRYSFDPLERRGVLLGLQPAQLLTLGVVALLAFAADRSLGRSGQPVGLLILTAGVASAVWTRGGRPASTWFVELVAWVVRRARGPLLDERPLHGTLDSGRPSRAAGARSLEKTVPSGVELAELSAEPGSIAILLDRRDRRWIAVLPVKGGSFALLDPEDQARRLEGWRVTLNSLGRPGTAVRRVQWIQRSHPGVAAGVVHGSASVHSGATSTVAVESYRALVLEAKPSQHHESWIAIAVDGPPSSGSAAGRRAEQVLRRELRLLEGQLRNADLQPSAPLDRARLASTIGGAYEAPAERPVGAGCWEHSSPWPVAEDEQWSYLRSGGSCHATYWIADWPRIEVGPDFLMPLLMGEGRRTVSLVMEPVPPERAAREVRSARTADAADEQLRSRAGFLPSARRGREAEGVMRREAELAEGHAEFRYSGYVTVHAADRESLDLACAEAEHAAQASQLELRRLYGRQHEAFTWTLPLARGLR